MKYAKREFENKKIKVGIKLRPSTLTLLKEASTLSGMSYNSVLEDGGIKEAKKTIKKHKRS